MVYKRSETESLTRRLNITLGSKMDMNYKEMKNPELDQIEKINEELVDVKKEFISLVKETSEDYWERKFKGEIWTIKEEMVHIVQALQILPKGINRAITESGRSFLSYIPSGLRGWVNGYIIVPRLARKLTSESLINEYEKAHIALLLTLERISGKDWQKGTKYPQKFRTVEEMFHRPKEHFEEHARNIRRKQNVS